APPGGTPPLPGRPAARSATAGAPTRPRRNAWPNKLPSRGSVSAPANAWPVGKTGLCRGESGDRLRMGKPRTRVAGVADQPAYLVGEPTASQWPLPFTKRAQGAHHGVLPMRTHVPAHAVRIEIQGFADTLEGEDPGAIRARDPGLGLPQDAAAATAPPGGPAADVDRILQERDHEAILAGQVAPSLLAAEELRGNDGGRFDEASDLALEGPVLGKHVLTSLARSSSPQGR